MIVIPPTDQETFVFGEQRCLIVMDNDAGRQPEILWRTFHVQKVSKGDAIAGEKLF